MEPKGFLPATGANDFLKKPVQLDGVVKEVQAIRDHFLINGRKPS
jgi:FixJ family two-component response regulator